MNKYKRLILRSINRPIEIEEGGCSPEHNQVTVDLKAAALNHRDLWISKGKYAGIQLPCVLGSDGVGVLDGRRVLIQPGVDWGDNEAYQSKLYHMIGMPGDGSFAEKICISPEQLYAIPDHLDFHQAAALPLAGITAWRALMTKGKPQPGETILITGIGGGVALAVLKFAVAFGLRVFVTSGNEQKISKAQSLGAVDGVSYKDPEMAQKLKEMSGGLDIIIDSAGGDALSGLMPVCNPGGRIVMYGGTLGKMNGISPQILFWKQLSLMGTTMGSPGEFADMLDFVTEHRIVPVIDSIYPLERFQEAYDRLASGDHFGKIVFDIL